MRKFLVCYRTYSGCGEYEYYTTVITLNKDEKANPGTFDKILNGLGRFNKEILSWSLIENE